MRIAVLVMLLAAIAPSTADACKCLQLSPAAAVKQSEVVFVGKIVAIDDESLTVKVSGVWKGAATSTMTVATGRSSCSIRGAGVKLGKTWVFAARRFDGKLHVRQCDGSRRATDAAIAAFDRVAGAARPPG